eukprot:TRINITY_DN7079_c0_g4_i3.p1 TRINITY_DN7079_c0_g4~~TRINITY_DN7079_c0_g4_i3.p1  ORF type:complete len:272 (+),score=99.67 TRINITY_DN7079_c0_g4_i3:27-818(+)
MIRRPPRSTHCISSAASDVYKRQVLNSSMMYPKKNDSESDRKAAERGMIYSLDWIAHPVFTGDYPQIMKDRAKGRMPEFTEDEKKLLINSTDFLGINHYFSELCTEGHNTDPHEYWGDRNVDTSKDPKWKRTDSDWPIVPEGMHDLLMYMYNKWTKKANIPIWVTESGMSLKEESRDAGVNDEGRIDYHKQYIAAMGRAMKDGANVGAYFVWSLLDNFEWWSGYSKRFGMVRVEYTDPPQRFAKNSLRWYGEFIKNVTQNQAE